MGGEHARKFRSPIRVLLVEEVDILDALGSIGKRPPLQLWRQILPIEDYRSPVKHDSQPKVQLLHRERSLFAVFNRQRAHLLSGCQWHNQSHPQERHLPHPCKAERKAEERAGLKGPLVRVQARPHISAYKHPWIRGRSLFSCDSGRILCKWYPLISTFISSMRRDKVQSLTLS